MYDMTQVGREGLRVRVQVRGLVQGVGFRPFVYALARELALSGCVSNTADGLVAEVEGDADDVAEFTRRIGADAPPLAHVASVDVVATPAVGGTDFVIGTSERGVARTLVSPDVGVCDDCVRELGDPGDVRYRHPFISCTNCGPRFTIVRELPYDRPATTMAELPLCPRCATQYADPSDRRFHAQTVACPECGPTLTLRTGTDVQEGEVAVTHARQLLGAGAIVAVKGIGGYHLACDATNRDSVATLRKRKDRGDKPFAVMVADIDVAAELAEIGAPERALLLDIRRPVVLLARRRIPAVMLADGSPRTAPTSA